MSPPIREGSGNDIGAIRLGDGSEISEVRTGAGDVLFSGSALPLNAIPDSGDLHSHFDVSDKSSIDPLQNETSESDLPIEGSPTLLTSEKNGLNVASYDGVDDGHKGTFSSSVSAPYHWFFAFQWDEQPSSNNKSFMGAQDETPRIISRNSDYRMISSGGDIIGGSSDLNWHIGNAYWDDGTNSYMRIDGTEIISGDIGFDSVPDFVIGNNGSNSNYFNSKLGELLIYPQSKTSIQGDVEQYLSDKWNIPI